MAFDEILAGSYQISKQPQNLNLSHEMDLDFSGCFGRESSI